MNTVAREYLENRIRMASPLELVVIIYEGAIQHLMEAKLAIEGKSIDKKVVSINRASRFIAELQLSLNTDKGGEIGTALAKLYNYFQRRLLEANLQNSPEILDEILTHLRGLHESWVQVSRQQGAELKVPKIEENVQSKPAQKSGISFNI